MATCFVAIDFELANYGRDSACSVGLVRVEDGKTVAKISKLINPDSYFISEFFPIHGITLDDVANEPAFDKVWEELAPVIAGADFFAAHNAPFDRSVLQGCCARYKVQIPPQKFICSMRVARKMWNIYPTTLPDVCNELAIELDHHQALSDANACAEIMITALNEGYQI